MSAAGGSRDVLERDRSLLVVIDFQGRLAHAVEQAEPVLAATRRLLAIASLFEVPVVLSEQYPEGLGPTEPSIQEAFDAHPGPKRKIAKVRFSCCGDPGFEAALDQLLPTVPASGRQVVVAGIEAHVCVMQTTLELRRRGTGVYLCAECVSGRGRDFRSWALTRMQAAGAVVTNHESAAFEWAGDKDHPRFRDLNRLLREGQVEGYREHGLREG